MVIGVAVGVGGMIVGVEVGGSGVNVKNNVFVGVDVFAGIGIGYLGSRVLGSLCQLHCTDITSRTSTYQD